MGAGNKSQVKKLISPNVAAADYHLPQWMHESHLVQKAACSQLLGYRDFHEDLSVLVLVMLTS